MAGSTLLVRRTFLKGTLGACVLATPNLSVHSEERFVAIGAGQTYDLRAFLVGDGLTNNDARFDALLSHMAANPGATYRGHNGDCYACSFKEKLIPNNIRLMLEGAFFLWNNDMSGLRGLILKFGEDFTFDAIRFRFLAGARFERGIEFSHRTCGDLVEVIADQQIANGGITNLDGAVRIYGHDSKFGTIKAQNLDRPIKVYGPTGGPLLNLAIGHVDIENYVTGLAVRNVTGLTVKEHSIRGRSPNGRPDPGQNGILVSSLKEARFEAGYVNDAPEHAYRVGGSESGEQESDNISFVKPSSRRSGQCGFKAWSGKNPLDAQSPLKHISVLDGTFMDCGDDDDPGLGFNDFGVMAQDCQDSLFEGVVVTRQDLAFCAYHGFYVSGPTRTRFLNCQAYGAYVNSLRVSQYHDHGSNSQPVDGLTITNFVGFNPGAENIYVECPTSSVSYLLVTDAQLVAGTKGVSWEGPASSATDANYISAAVQGQAGARFDVPLSSNLEIVDLMI